MFCNRTKEFLSQHAIAFDERDVSSDESAMDDLQSLGLMTTPVILIENEAVVGFDRAKLSRLLEIG